MPDMTSRIRETGKWVMFVLLVYFGGNYLTYWAADRSTDRRLVQAKAGYDKALVEAKTLEDGRHADGVRDRQSIRATTDVERDMIAINTKRLIELERRLAAAESRVTALSERRAAESEQP